MRPKILKSVGPVSLSREKKAEGGVTFLVVRRKLPAWLHTDVFGDQISIVATYNRKLLYEREGGYSRKFSEMLSQEQSVLLPWSYRSAAEAEKAIQSFISLGKMPVGGLVLSYVLGGAVEEDAINGLSGSGVEIEKEFNGAYRVLFDGVFVGRITQSSNRAHPAMWTIYRYRVGPQGPQGNSYKELAFIKTFRSAKQWVLSNTEAWL